MNDVPGWLIDAPAPIRFAPGWPGIPVRWTSGAKTGKGTVLGMVGRSQRLPFPRPAILAGAGWTMVMWCMHVMAIFLLERVGRRPSLLTEVPGQLYPSKVSNAAMSAWIFICRWVPETKGKSLEEIEAHWLMGRHPRAL